MPKVKFEFDGFDEVLSKLKKLDAEVKPIADEALAATHKLLTPKIHSAMKPHHKTGKTEDSIVDSTNTEWAGYIGSVDVGFDLKKRLVSIFLMYGTEAHKVIWHGTPRNHPGTKADKTLYNAVYGKGSEVKNIQADIFYAALRRLGG